MITTLRVAALAAALLFSTSATQARIAAVPAIITCDRVCSDWHGAPKAQAPSATRDAKVRMRVLEASDAMLPNERMEHYTKLAATGSTDVIRTRRGSAPIRSYDNYNTYNRVYAGGATVIGGMPAECERWVARIPSIRRLFCGCGTAAKVGLDNSDGRYNVVRGFLVHPRTPAAPGMVAIAPNLRHVMVLETRINGNIWTVYNPNGGRNLTWRMPFNIAGWIIVDPTKGGHAEKKTNTKLAAR